MLLFPRNKQSFYKRFVLDVWGVLKSSLSLRFKDEGEDFEVPKKKDWVCRFFFNKSFFSKKFKFKFKRRFYYKLNEPLFGFSFKGRKRSKVDFKFMKLHYATLSYKRIRKFFRLSKKKDGPLEHNYMFYLESRTVFIIYRVSISPNVFEAIRFVRKKSVNVDKKYVLLVNKKIKPLKLIRIRLILKGFIFGNMVKRLDRSAFLSSIPRYIYFSYQFLFFFLYKKPQKKDVVNPFPLDIYKITGFEHVRKF